MLGEYELKRDFLIKATRKLPGYALGGTFIEAARKFFVYQERTRGVKKTPIWGSPNNHAPPCDSVIGDAAKASFASARCLTGIPPAM